MQYFAEQRGNIYAILNHKQRRDPGDVIVPAALTPDKQKLVYRLRNKGMSDSTIFMRLFPASTPAPPPPPKRAIPVNHVTVDIDILTKVQLVDTITKELQNDMPSLKQMSKADLQLMLKTLQKRRS
jgi:hypothetical protein